MKELDFEEKRYQSILDSARRDKKRYHYASDITFREGIVTEPNTVVRDIISQDIPYWKVISHSPTEHDNEWKKGRFFRKQTNFTRQHEGETLLCEALDAQPCLQMQCPLYVPAGGRSVEEVFKSNRHGAPVCSEYKFVFEKRLS